MNSREKQPRSLKSWTRYARGLIYIIIIGLIAMFLVKLGNGPWLVILGHKWLFLVLVLLSAAGIYVQAGAFRASSPLGNFIPSLASLTKVWGLSAVISVIAPLVAGVASRTVLLVREGMSIGECMVASGRQVWLGLEMAFLIGASALWFCDWPLNKIGFFLLVSAWFSLVLLRYAASHYHYFLLKKSNRLSSLLKALSQRAPASAYPWLIGQLFVMGAIYLVGFNSVGATFSIFESLALASLTVIVSLIFFVPNGLGITDTLWVFIAKDAGLSLDQSVAVAIMFRFAHLIASVLVMLIFWFFDRRTLSISD